MKAIMKKIIITCKGIPTINDERNLALDQTVIEITVEDCVVREYDYGTRQTPKTL